MFTNYFKIAWRNLSRGKSFSFINISGLAIGMAGAVLILLWIQYEISFDKFHSNKERLYQVYGLTSSTAGAPVAIPVTSQPLVPALKQSYPEVERATHVKSLNKFLVTSNNKSFIGIEAAVVDEDFLEMFNFPLLKGNKEEQLRSVSSITITEKLAIKLFGNEDPIGKSIKLDSSDLFTVTGVLKDLPSNTRFDFEYLLPWPYLKKLGTGYSNENWLSNNTPGFILLKAGTNADNFNSKIGDFTRKNSGRTDVWTHFIFPLSKWHLYSEFENGKAVGGPIDKIRVFAAIAVFILLIACINFMNLSTARSEKRAKEVGVRKVAGAAKGWLIGQFIMEAFLTALISGIIALLIVEMLLPLFNNLINSQLDIHYNNPIFWLCAFGFILFTSLLAGSYPAFYLSSFKPIGIFKKQFKKSHNGISPRKVLVVLQFTVAIILIISTLVIRNQVQYAQDRDSGYSRNNLIHVDFVGDIEKNYSLLRNELIQSGIATNVSKNMMGINEGGARSWGLRWQNEAPKDTNTTITVYSTDADFAKTAGLKILQGRDVDIYNYPSDSFSVVLNETAVKLMGFKDPIGQIINEPYSGSRYTVVGVVKDYIVESAYSDIPPIVIMGPSSWFSTMHIRFDPNGSTAQLLEKTERVFRKYNSAYPFNFQFIDQEYAKQFADEQRTKTMAGLFAGLAVLISCLGLFGLSAFIAETRIKEIGVRKVLGASTFNIAQLLSTDFLKLVIISILVGSPIAWWSMNKWLDDFSYRITIDWSVIALAALIAISIALLTVSFQSLKAAISNPVKSLRSE